MRFEQRLKMKKKTIKKNSKAAPSGRNSKNNARRCPTPSMTSMSS